MSNNIIVCHSYKWIDIFKKDNPEYKDWRTVVQASELEGIYVEKFIDIGMGYSKSLTQVLTYFRINLEEYLNQVCNRTEEGVTEIK